MAQHRFLLTCVAALALALPAPAMAGTLTLTMSPWSQNATQGGSGYILDFTLTVAPGDSVNLSGFNVTVTTDSSSGITFTGGDSSVSNYVFAGNSFGLDFGNPSGSNTADIIDLTNTAYQTVTAGTYGLGEIFFSVAANAPTGIVNITLDSATSFTDDNSVPLGYTPASGTTIGTVDIGPSSVVPEPSSLLMCSIGVATGLVSLTNRRRMIQKA